MSFPESQRVEFRENPLVEVICQLTFPSILTIATQPPAEFQERVRELFPIYEREAPMAAFPPELAKLLTELPVPLPVAPVVHRFRTEDTTQTVSLTSEFVAISVTNYAQWAGFRAVIEHVKQSLEDVFRPAFYVRIGLRYRDVIDRARLGLSEVAWRELLAPELLGILGAPDSVGQGVRGLRGEALIALDQPPAGFVKLAYGLVDETDGSQYMVDADWFTTERRATDEVFDALDDFNRQAGDVFRWAIAPPLRDAMGTRDN